MKILHTSDWHLGRSLEGFSRMEEQKAFLSTLCDICEEEQIDLIVVSGDVFDNGNPSAAAQELFFHSAKCLTDNGRRPLIAIAGNHDSAQRLTAPDSLAYEHGLILIGTPLSVAKKGKYTNFSIEKSEAGVFELSLRGETAVIVTMPYPSERRLNTFFETALYDEEQMQKSYSAKVGELFCTLEEQYRQDTVNIAMGHFYVAGGQESESERPIQLGGAFAVERGALPKKAQYTALGHLHRMQRAGNSTCFYSGSPLEYSKSECGSGKYVIIAQVRPGCEAAISTRRLHQTKPIVIWKAEGIENAFSIVQSNSETPCWAYLEIKTAHVINQSDIKALRAMKPDLLEILPVMAAKESVADMPIQQEKTLQELFCSFYEKQRTCMPTPSVTQLFLEIVEEGCKDEADTP